MELNPGAGPEASQHQNKVGGALLALKGIFTNIKEKMLGIPPQNQITSEKSDSAADRRASEVITTQNTPHNTEFESHLTGESSSRDLVDAKASELTKTSTCPNKSYRTEQGDPERLGADLCSLVAEKKTLTSEPSHMMGEISFEDLFKMTAPKDSKVHTTPDNIPEASKEVKLPIRWGKSLSEDQPEVKLENGDSLLEEAMPGIVGGFDRNQKADVEHLMCSLNHLTGEASRILQKDGASGVTLVGNGSHQLDKKTETFLLNADSGVGKVRTSSNGAQNVKGLADQFRTMNDQSAREIPCKQSNSLTPRSFLDETLGENITDIKDLIDCFKQSGALSHNSFICTDSEQVSSRGSPERAQPRANLQDFDTKRGQASLKTHAMGKESNKLNGGPSTGIPFMTCSELSENEQDSISDFSASDYIKSKPIAQVPIPANKKDLDSTLTTNFAKERSTKNKALVRFLLRNVPDSQIMSAFEDCGPIMKIQQISSGSIFKDVYLHFKEREGLEKALKKTDLMVKGADVTVQAASFVENEPSRIFIPELIGDPDVPAAQVKNPTRTVKIKQLTDDISSHQLKEALAFCGSGISNFYLGSSSCVAYVEFETEDSKERAIAKHSIHVSGKQLLIFRIDAPRTTVVRISNFGDSKGGIHRICRSYGEVKRIVDRYLGSMDMHFKLCEWPNMLHILNRLNGMEVDGHQLLAQPAPVFPPEILQALWSQPDERKYVIAAMCSLAKNVGDPIDMTHFLDLTVKRYGL
uniref:RRM domain-containing protein n=1 Tax=Fagus sylvatica TaxID=28930 RepID=A0A2N9FDQ4_FAGSY